MHVSFLSPVFYPNTLWTPNYFGALAGNGGTQLLVSPVQYRAASVADGTSTQRRHTGMNLRLFYSANLSQAALSDPPSIIAVDAQPDATGVTFSAQVIGDPAAAIYQVWIIYTGRRQHLDLARLESVRRPAAGQFCASEDSRLWKGRLASPPANLKYFVQAVNGVGLVAFEDNGGGYFGLTAATPAATTNALVIPAVTAAIGDSVDFTTKLTIAGVPVAGRTVTVSVGGVSQLGITGADGSVTVKLPIAAAPGAYQVTATFAGDDQFQASSSTTSFVVSKAATSLTPLAPVGAILTGTLAGKTVALQQEAVSFAVTGPGGATTLSAITDYLGQATLPPPGLPAGDYTVTQATYGGNATYTGAFVALAPAQQFTVAKTNQSITFTTLGNKTVVDPDFAVFATASSGLTVSFAASGSCTVLGNTVHITGTGSCTITAAQGGDVNYNAATSVARTFTVVTSSLADQVIVFGPAPTNVTLGDPPVTVSATSTSPSAPPSNIPIILSSQTTAVCTTGGTNGATVTLVAAGICTIAANQAGNANYNPAPQVLLGFSVAGVGPPPTMQFNPTGAMATARSDHTATLLLDGRVLIAGGLNAAGAPLNSAELYCPDNAQAPPSFVLCPAAQRGAFIATNNMPVAAAGHTATRLHDGTVLVLGGGNANVQWFTPSDQSWALSM